MTDDSEMKTAYRVLREGAQMLREHCAPVAIWRELDDKADALEQGINPFPPTPHHETSLPVVKVSESPDD